jgi:large-conductance mechanosensitive channel
MEVLKDFVMKGNLIDIAVGFLWVQLLNKL